MIKLLITGSHQTPAQALIEQLPRKWIVFQLDNRDGPKFKRYDWWGSLKDSWRLPGLIWQFKNQLQLVKPNVVISFGGYGSVPVVAAAKLLRLPIIIHEQTFSAGLASRFTGYLAEVIAISWLSSRRCFPQGKTVLIGNPLRQKIINLVRKPKNSLYITGGNQGSRAINQVIEPILPQLVKEFTVYHQFGLNQPPAYKDRRYISRPYFSVGQLAQIYAQARLVVGRSGINTVTELGFLRIPSVLIPLPFTQKNEQAVNAHYLEKLGLAVVLPQERLTPANLLAALDQAQKLRPSKIKFPRERVKNAAQRLFKLCSNLL